RGVLRLLSLVIYSLRQAKIPFIRLCDFDLRNDDIRRELVNHIGHEFDSVIAQDITSPDAGAKKVDKSLGSSYLPYSFGTKVATTIFMYSFSGGPEKGCGVNEIKMSCVETDAPSSIITEAISKLEENLFYLQYDGRYFFSNQPNLNRILLTKMEGINDAILMEKEKELLSENVRKKQFEIFIYGLLVQKMSQILQT
ncbi:MAG: AAA family ATPase, partial [Candidatus Heimdallarchaeota archaeon]|nr:AAA family ATPase [Candidatus Heimdallarchaeota archaeon]